MHPPFFLNEPPVVMKDEQKHLGITLDSAFNFHSHEGYLSDPLPIQVCFARCLRSNAQTVPKTAS